MNCEIQNKKRRSIRLKGYDYSASGLYFITICTWNHLHLFGEMVDDQMILNSCGQIAGHEWYRTGELRSNIRLHEFVIMPNHMHGIIEIINCKGVDSRGKARCALITAQCTPQKDRFGKLSPNTIPTIIRSYKGAVTKQIRELNNNPDLNIWQRNYYEHII